MKKTIVFMVMLFSGMLSFLFGQTNIYLSGAAVINKKQVACYWKNGTRFDLKGGVGNISSDTSGIYVFEGKVYVIGRYWNGSTMMPCVWINEEKNNLDIGTEGTSSSGGRTSSVIVTKKGVLIGGDWSKNYKTQPCYWLNGKRIDLTFPNDGGIGSTVESVYMTDKHLYACGFYYKGGIAHACYWIDGKYMELKIKDEDKSGAYKIIQTNNDIFICGDYERKNKKNGFLFGKGIIKDIEDSLSASDIFNYNGTIYILGITIDYSPCYWKGIQETIFSQSSDSDTSYDVEKIFIYENTVYVCGAYTWDQGYSRQGCYWINQKPIMLEKESKDISGIYVGKE
jgi:hypothetical protein